MLAFSIVEHLDILKAGDLHGGMAGMTYAMYPLILDAVEPALGGRVIPTVALAAHRAGQAIFGSHPCEIPESRMGRRFKRQISLKKSLRN